MMRSEANTPCKPFLKWPGGKRWLSPILLNMLSGVQFRRYFEPFLGGGALFFALRPRQAILSDVNSELIDVYRQVRGDPLTLIREIRKIPVTNEAYDAIRHETGGSAVRRAARFLFLNRTAFAGMYRLNREGKFNVPFGGGERRPNPLWEDNLLLNAASALRRATLCCEDFEAVLTRAEEGDLVFCDPTYTVAHNNNGFVRYNETNFRWSDQERLARLCRRLRAKGVTVVVSNAFHNEIRSLYRDAFVRAVSRPSTLCPVSEKRRTTREYLFLFRP